MKRKTIKAILTKSFKDYLESIQDECVRDVVSKNTIITGGSIASMLLNEKVNDLDLYFRTFDTAVAVANYYVAKFNEAHPTTNGCTKKPYVSVDTENQRVAIYVKSAGIAGEEGDEGYQYFEGSDPNSMETEEFIESAMSIAQDSQDITKPKYRPVFLSPNAITLSNGIQLVLRFHGEPEEIHKNYDFVHCTNYWTSWDKELVLRGDALECILNKELRYQGSLYPVCSMFRVRKFINRGWSITAGQMLKMAMQISNLDLCRIDVLQDQLIGVDVAYFLEVIEKLKEKDTH